jgi:hypothetical protein
VNDESVEIPPDDVVEDVDLVEEVHGLPVIAEVRELERVPVVGLGAVYAAAAAATGFVAGAATLALARRYGARRVERLQHGGLQHGGLQRGGMLPVTGTRTYIVRVHVVRQPWE